MLGIFLVLEALAATPAATAPPRPPVSAARSTPVPSGAWWQDTTCGVGFKHPVDWLVTRVPSTTVGCLIHLQPKAWKAIAASSELLEPEVPLTVWTSRASLEEVFAAAHFLSTPDGQWRVDTLPAPKPCRVKTDYWFGLRASIEGRSYYKDHTYSNVSELPIAALSSTGGLRVVIEAESGGTTYDVFELVLASIRPLNK